MLIPEGWYLIGENETIELGDMCSGNDEGYEHLGSWGKCLASVGDTPKHYSTHRAHGPFHVIRKGQPPKPKDPEWMNPWD